MNHSASRPRSLSLCASENLEILRAVVGLIRYPKGYLSESREAQIDCTKRVARLDFCVSAASLNRSARSEHWIETYRTTSNEPPLK
jgi:hypothetical protein